MAILISVDDLAPFAPDLVGPRGEAMIADVLARVAIVAPCLSSASDPVVLAQAKAHLRAAILRRHDSLGGARRTESATHGPYGQSVTIDTRPVGARSAAILTDSEETTLAALCGAKPTTSQTLPVGSFPSARRYDDAEGWRC